jgi:predicted alpha/beta-hydrolase family hydrolase
MRELTGLVLFHGAGGDRDHHTFLALEAGLDLPVARVDFPYRRKGPGRRPPDRMPRLVDAVAEASATWAREWGLAPEQLVLGGRSLGGRAASMAVADGAVPARALVLLSYPLHPPGKPDRLRVEHFERITCPVLLVQGNRDPFGSPEEFARELPAIGGPVTEVWIDAAHDPRGGCDDVIVAQVARWLTTMGRPSGRRG